MGNEGSRAMGDGLTPRGYSPGPSPGVPQSPRTPTGGGGIRRAKSFHAAASSSTPNGDAANPAIDRTIQRMDRTIRKRVRGGITYNMKIILRGDRGTGKTSLFQRLKGEPIPSTHAPTPQLQSATINWSFRANSEESVKCDVWDVVDKGFSPNGDAEAGPAAGSDVNPFEAAAASQQNSAHAVACVDATTVDVYHETHGVVFLLDVTKPHTLEYVRQQLDQVPAHIPTLVLGNFRDCSAQRKIFKEDIQELLYGGGAAQHQPLRRPHELLYFECSLLNCYGLKALHQYFGIPFLQLKQLTVRQQLRILEGEFTHLKHDLQAKIAEQRYADYLDHIKSTGSDIRTGRRGAAAAAAAANGGVAPSTGNGDVTVAEEDSPTSKTRIDRTLSSSSDIVMSAETTQEVPSSASAQDPPATSAQATQQQQVDLEDLPDRAAAMAQAGNSLKIDYSEEERRASRRQQQMPALPGFSTPTIIPEAGTGDVTNGQAKVDTSSIGKKDDAVTTSTAAVSAAAGGKKAADGRKQAPEAEVAMNLEDFQVPKPRHNDLDSFYSDDDSEEEVRDDDDVVVSASGARMSKSASATYHKQKFLDSDESDSDTEGSNMARKASAAPQSKQRSPRRHVMKPTSDEHPVTLVAAPTTTSPPELPPPSPVRPSLPLVPPRTPASPPRPTVSPSHSPRRRVKDASPTAQEDTEVHIHAVELRGDAKKIEPDDLDSTCEVNYSVEEAMEPLSAVKVVVECVSAQGEKSQGDIEVPIPLSTLPNEPQSLSGPGLDEVPVARAHNVEPERAVEDDVAVSRSDEMEAFLSDSETEEVKVITGIERPVENCGYKDEGATPTAQSTRGDVVAEPLIGHTQQPPQATVPEASVPRAPVITEDCEDERNRGNQVSGMVFQVQQQQHVGDLALSDDDSDEVPVKTTRSSEPVTFARRDVSAADVPSRKVEMIMSDDDSDQDEVPLKPPTHRHIQRVIASSDADAIPSPPLAPAAASASGNLGDILEAFLIDSGSESDSTSRPPLSRTAPKPSRAAVIDSDEEDDGDDDRFSAYTGRRTHRQNKTARKQQRDDVSLKVEQQSLSSSRTSSFSTTSENNTTSGSLINQDVLAAIRKAEEDAMRMLEQATPIGGGGVKNVVAVADGDVETASKKKKTSSRKKSSKGDDFDGADDDSKKKKTKKKKEGASSRSKRREIILTDEE